MLTVLLWHQTRVCSAFYFTHFSHCSTIKSFIAILRRPRTFCTRIDRLVGLPSFVNKAIKFYDRRTKDFHFLSSQCCAIFVSVTRSVSFCDSHMLEIATIENYKVSWRSTKISFLICHSKIKQLVNLFSWNRESFVSKASFFRRKGFCFFDSSKTVARSFVMKQIVRFLQVY